MSKRKTGRGREGEGFWRGKELGEAGEKGDWNEWIAKRTWGLGSFLNSGLRGSARGETVLVKAAHETSG